MTTEQAINEIVSSGYGQVQCHEETMRMAVDALRAQQARENPKPQWFSVKDRLPKDGKNVLVLIPYREVILNYVSYRESDEWYVPDRLGRFSLRDVTHWMPLPEPPKEAQK